MGRCLGRSGDLDLGWAQRWAGQRDKGRGHQVGRGGPATPPELPVGPPGEPPT